MGAEREPGQGTATMVQAVNDLPKAQASRRDEFAGTSRGSSHRSQSQSVRLLAHSPRRGA